MVLSRLDYCNSILFRLSANITQRLRYVLSSFFKSSFLCRWHNSSSPFIPLIYTPLSLTYKTLYNRALPVWLPIFSPSTLLKLNFFLLVRQLAKLHTCRPRPISYFNTTHFARNLDEHLTFCRQISSLSNSCYTTCNIFVNFAVSTYIAISKQPAPLPPSLYILNLTIVILWHKLPNVWINLIQHIQNSQFTSSFTCQAIFVIITTLSVHYAFTLLLQAQNCLFNKFFSPW